MYIENINSGITLLEFPTKENIDLFMKKKYRGKQSTIPIKLNQTVTMSGIARIWSTTSRKVLFLAVSFSLDRLTKCSSLLWQNVSHKFELTEKNDTTEVGTIECWSFNVTRLNSADSQLVLSLSLSHGNVLRMKCGTTMWRATAVWKKKRLKSLWTFDTLDQIADESVNLARNRDLSLRTLGGLQFWVILGNCGRRLGKLAKFRDSEL